MNLSKRDRLVIAVVAEGLYTIGRFALPAFREGISQQLIWTALRLPLIALYCWLFLDAVKKPVAASNIARPTALAIVVVLAVATIAYGGFGEEIDVVFRLVLVVTAPISVFREELFDRLVVQKSIDERWGARWAVAGATFFFVVAHFGSAPMSYLTVSYLGATGLIYGLVFQKTQSIWLSVVLHTLFNVSSAISPGADQVLPGVIVVGNLIVVISAFGWWMAERRSNRNVRRAPGSRAP